MSKLHEQYDQLLRENYDLVKRNEALIAKLEIAEKALALTLQYTHNENAYDAIVEALKAIRE